MPSEPNVPQPEAWRNPPVTPPTGGAVGPAGPAGSIGPAGSDGAVGADGAQGIQGTQGIQGLIGVQGVPGEPGADAEGGGTVQVVTGISPPAAPAVNIIWIDTSGAAA